MRPALDDLRHDTRHGLRLLAKNRGFTVVAALTLALGIGATTAIFSVLYASVLAPLPFRDPERLVSLQEVNGEGRNRGIPIPTTEMWRNESKALDGVAYILMGQVPFPITGPAGAERVVLEQVDLYTLQVLGVRPILGRLFRPDEPIVQGDLSQTMIISYGLWQRLFGGDPDVVGKRMPGWTAGWGEIVAGVMPQGFYTHPARANTDGWYVIRNSPGATIARLAAGVTPAQAQSELDIIARRRDPPAAGPWAPKDTWRITAEPLHDRYRRGYAQTLYMLLGAVGFVLLIAAVNVANLQLNRGLSRQTEMATRIALGAGRGRLFRQLVIENVMLVLVGGVLGIGVALAGIKLFVALAPGFYPPSQEIAINGPVLLFTFAVCVATGLLSGLAPGLRASNPDLHASLKQGVRGGTSGLRIKLRRVLVVSEVALAMVLLVGAGLMINSYARATSVEMGLDPDNVLRVQVSLMGMDKYRTRFGGNHYAATSAGSRVYGQLLDRMAALPGVESVGVTSSLPPGGGFPIPFRVLGGAAPPDAVAAYHEVSPDFFKTMRVPVRRGRTFTDRDNETAPGVVIVNETFARQFFPGADPIGQSIQTDMTRPNPKLQQDRLREVVGIVGDVRTWFRREFEPIVYVPYLQHLADYPTNGHLAIHTIKEFVARSSSGDPMSLAPAVRKIMAELDPGVALGPMMPVRESLSAAAGAQQFWMQLLGIFAGLGVFLAAIGIYGVVSYSVEQRTHEFGLRTALGAQKADIMKLVLREGAAVTLLGLVLGTIGAYASTRLIEAQLFGVGRMDPVTIAAVAAVLLAISLFACFIPARRTTKLDPLLALRVD